MAGAAHATTIHITNYNASVSNPGGFSGTRSPWPSHHVLVGDRADIVAFVCHDGPIQGTVVSFTTTAPTTNHIPGPNNTGLMTANNPPEPCGFTHTLPAGWATFPTAGRYQVTITASARDVAPASATFDLFVDDLPRVVTTPLTVNTCLRPAIRITSPTAATGMCVGRPTHVNAQVTLHGCTPYTLTVRITKPDGTVQTLPSRTNAPWTVTFVPMQGGNYQIAAEIRDRNGAASTATVNLAANRCPPLPMIQPKH